MKPEPGAYVDGFDKTRAWLLETQGAGIPPTWHDGVTPLPIEQPTYVAWMRGRADAINAMAVVEQCTTEIVNRAVVFAKFVGRVALAIVCLCMSTGPVHELRVPAVTLLIYILYLIGTD